MARVCVVGAGVVGACAALRLAQAGAEVTVLDAGAPAGGTSATSFAWAGASHHGLRDYLELHVDGLRAYRRLELEMDARAWFARTGCLTWRSDPAAAGSLAAHLEDLGRRGYAASWLTPAAVTRDLEPDLRFGASVDEVAFLPDEAHVAPVPMVRDVLGAARAGGAVVRTGVRVREIAVRGDAVAGVTLAGGEPVAADRVVVCAGRGSSALVATAGGHLPLLAPDAPGSPALGLLVVTAPLPARVRRASTPTSSWCARTAARASCSTATRTTPSWRPPRGSIRRRSPARCSASCAATSTAPSTRASRRPASAAAS